MRMSAPIGRLVILLAALVAWAGPGAAGPPEAVSRSPFGVVCPWPAVEKAGIQWCRVGAGATALANWPDIEKSPGAWDWTAADNELKQYAESLGLNFLPIFGYTPRWASRTPEDAAFHAAPPKDLATFSRFVRQCVARYKHRVRVWEVWNEPNIGFFRGSAAEYARMVKAAAVAAKQEDPECRIAMGCAGVDIDFLQRLYEFGCGPYFDIMSVHPYQWGQQLNDGWMIDKLQSCRQLMDRHGDVQKEIWITEIGWSMGEGVTSQQQANLLVQALVTALSVRERLKVEKVFWFCVKDWGGPGFGLFDVDGKPKPAFTAYQALTSELAQAHYRGPWKAPDGVRGHIFERAGGAVLVHWTPSADGKAHFELKTSSAKLSLRAVTGEQVEVIPKKGLAGIDSTHAPLFVSGLKMSELEPPPEFQAAPSVPSPEKKSLPDVWVSVVPPPTTARPYLVLGGYNELPLEIRNDGREAARGELQVEVAVGSDRLAAGRMAFEVAPGSSQMVVWRAEFPAREDLAGELAILHVRGTAAGKALPEIDVPVRLVRWKGVEFAANSWIEQQYLHKADKSGCADSVRFGSEFGYQFDLRNARSAQLRINLGANGANPWNLLVSSDDKNYTSECSGKSWPGWHTVALDKHLAEPREGPATVYLKIQGTDCQVREIILEAEAHCGQKPAR